MRVLADGGPSGGEPWTPTEVARALGGLMAVGALTALLLSDAIYPGVTANAQAVTVLLLLIAALLSIDMGREALNISVGFGNSEHDTGLLDDREDS